MAARDFGLDHNTAAGRVEIASVVAAWKLAKEFASKEIELRAEARVLGQKDFASARTSKQCLRQ